jgi:hypothetical protein
MTVSELSAGSKLRVAYLTAIEDDREEPSARALGRIVRVLEPADTSYERLARLLRSPEFDPSGEYAHAGALRSPTPPPPATIDLQPTGPVVPSVEPAPAVPTMSSERAESDHLVTAPALAEPSGLQFEHAVTELAPLPEGGVAVTCSACQRAIDTEYFDVNGRVLCDRCRTAAESVMATPSGIEPLIVASVFGLGAAIAGAIIYYAVIAIAHLQIGYVAILIGYMVGYAVRKGARGRGGLRFQILAVVLTYFAVGLAYTPLVFKQMETNRAARNVNASPTVVAQPQPQKIPNTTGPSLLWAALLLSFFVFALPVLVVLGSFPFGLISAFIIFIGLRQSWRMTAAPHIQVFGPYRVGRTATAGTA